MTIIHSWTIEEVKEMLAKNLRDRWSVTGRFPGLTIADIAQLIEPRHESDACGGELYCFEHREEVK